MGIIQRQSLKYTIVSYLGVFIGIFSVVFVYPLDHEIYGVANFILASAAVLAPLMSLGYSTVAIRYFQAFKKQQGNLNGFLVFLLSRLAVGIAAIIIIFLSLGDQFYTVFPTLPESDQDYRFHIILTAIFWSILVLLTNYANNALRIVWPQLFETLIKISLPALVLSYYFEYINEQIFVWGLVVNYFIIAVAIVVYLKKLGLLDLTIDFSFFTTARKKEIRTYAGYSLLTVFGSLLVFKIDTIMVTAYLGFGQVGYYGILVTLANVVHIPLKAVGRISNPLISKHMEEENIDEIKKIYQQSSGLLVIAGLFVFLLIIVLFPEITRLMNEGSVYNSLWIVLFILGLAKVIDVSAGVNSSILTYSKYFRYNLLTLIILGVLNITLNVFLIPTYGLTGAALATCISIAAFNVVKMSIIWVKLRIQPFQMSSLYATILFVLIYGISLYFPQAENVLISIMYKGLILVILYVGLTYLLGISKDFNNIINDTIKKRLSR